MRSLSTPLIDSATSYLLAQHHLADRTRQNYRQNLSAFNDWLLGGSGTLADLTPATVNGYASATVKAGHRYMARNVVATLKVLDRWLHESGITDAPRLTVCKLPRVPTEGRAPYSDKELRTILDVARRTRYGPRDYAIVTLALGCGLRLNEIRELTLDDIDLREGVLTVRGETSKSGRKRQVVLDPMAAAAADTYIKDWRKPVPGTRAIFTTNRNSAFTREGFSRILYGLQKPMEKAGVPNFICHRLRHTWATNAHRVGLSIFDIQEQGGWRKLDMVRRYTKSRPMSELKRLPTSLTGILRQSRDVA